MAIIQAEKRLIKFGPERKKLGELRGSLKAGLETEVPDDLMYILEEGTYEIVSEKKTKEAPKKSKKSKNNKEEIKVVDEVSIEDQSALDNE